MAGRSELAAVEAERPWPPARSEPGTGGFGRE